MAAIFEKLNLKGPGPILVVAAPASFEPELARLQGVQILRELGAAERIGFALLFVDRKAEVDRLADRVCAQAEGDALLWFAYPKGTSRKFKCDFNRDTGWDRVRAAGFEPVRQVAIDEDWSALRFRRTEYIR
jgi:hypothetical protein